MSPATRTPRPLSPSRLTSCGVRALMDAVPSNVALLDGEGTIVATNRAWDDQARGLGAAADLVGAGASYLAVCDQAASDLDSNGAAFGQGRRRVRQGQRRSFELDDRLVLDGEAHVIRGRATRIEDPAGTWVLVTHEDLSRPSTKAA